MHVAMKYSCGGFLSKHLAVVFIKTAACIGGCTLVFGLIFLKNFVKREKGNN